MFISPTVFRNYDIRGTYPEELNAETSYHIGKGLASLIKKQGGYSVVVGRDDRESSPELTKALINGLLDSGCNVTYTNITVTPAIHFFTTTMGFHLGICVTASHNPKNYNGYRLDYKNAWPIYGNDILEIKNIIEREDYYEGKGEYIEKDLNLNYENYLVKNVRVNKKIKVVVDCGSGASSEIGPKIFEGLGCDVVPVYCSYDSNFPHGVPDPENKIFLDELREHVLEAGADVGFAFDTDADRFGVVDNKGREYSTDMILLLFAETVLKENPGSKIAFDVKCSGLVEDVIINNGGIPKMIRTGHPYFMKEVEKDSIIGAEYSGHAYFADRYFGYDDGMYAACRVLEIMGNSDKSLSELMSKYPERVSTHEIKVMCPDEMKFEIVEELKNYAKHNYEYVYLEEIDGMRLKLTETGWFLIRASNTSPYLSVRAEGKDKEELDEMLRYISELISVPKNVKLVLNY